MSRYFARYIKKLRQIYEVITTTQDYLMEKFLIQVYFDEVMSGVVNDFVTQ
jgi:hypothetical protein